MKCKHLRKKDRDLPFGLFSGTNGAAQGGITVHSRCLDCGMEKYANINQNHYDTSKWFMPVNDEGEK